MLFGESLSLRQENPLPVKALGFSCLARILCSSEPPVAFGTVLRLRPSTVGRFPLLRESCPCSTFQTQLGYGLRFFPFKCRPTGTQLRDGYLLHRARKLTGGLILTGRSGYNALTVDFRRKSIIPFPRKAEQAPGLKNRGFCFLGVNQLRN